jgi:hypothetical protein
VAAMREVQGTRSEKGQGCDRARQRLHGLLRGVAVNAALVWNWERTRWWCGGEGRTWCRRARVLWILLSSNHEPSHDDVALAAGPGRLGPVASQCVFWQVSNVTVDGPQIAYASGTRSISLASGLSRPWRPLRCMNNEPWSPSAVTHDACRRPRNRV